MHADLLLFGERMRSVTLEALIACWAGDLDTMRERVGELARLAALSSDQDQLDLLATIADIDDAETGEIRLKPRPTE